MSLSLHQDSIKAKNFLTFKKRLNSYKTARRIIIRLNGKNTFC